MATKDGLKKHEKPCLYYHEHPEWKIGKTKRKDRQWVIRQTFDGETKVSTLGWAGKDGISEGDALNKIAEYKANYKWNKENPGEPQRAVCKHDEDMIVFAEAERLKSASERERIENLTINQMWDEFYLSFSQQHKKPDTVVSETSLFNTWIKRDLGNKRFLELTQLDYSRLAKKILSNGRSPRTVHYAVSVLLQMWNLAFDLELVAVQPPRRKKLKLPDIDNERTRAFTVKEAKMFLDALLEKSRKWHDISLLSLLTGMRASEVFKLKKTDIDLEKNLLYLRSPKKDRSQYLQISDVAKNHLIEMLGESSSDQDLLVVNKKREQIKEVSDSVERVINNLKLNEGVEDKDKLTFHSLRHTTATWLLEQGEDIFRVSKFLRHSTVKVTERRYAHLSNDTMKRTADKISKVLA